MKKFMAILLSMILMLSLSVVGFSASAEGDDAAGLRSDTVLFEDNKMTFYSIMNLSSNGISCPNVTYTYTLVNAMDGYYDSEYYGFCFISDEDDSTTLDYLTESYEFTYDSLIAEGVGDENVSTETAVFTPYDYADEDSCVTKDVTFDLGDIVFDDVGIYHYNIMETVNEDVAGVDNYEALTSYNEEYYVYRELFITVTHSADNEDEFEISNVIMVESTCFAFVLNNDDNVNFCYLIGNKTNFFEHAYGMGLDISMLANENLSPQSASNFDYEITNMAKLSGNAYQCYYVYEAGLYGQDLIITNTAFGDMASHTKEFTFTVSSENVDAGAVFEVVDADGNSSYIVQTDQGFYFATLGDNGIYDSNGTAFTFTLTDGEEYAILSVVEEMEFTVTISDAIYDGYSYYARDYYDTSYDDSNDDAGTEGEMLGIFEYPTVSLLSIFDVKLLEYTTEEDEEVDTSYPYWNSIGSNYTITIDEYYAYSQWVDPSPNMSLSDEYTILDLTAYNVPEPNSEYYLEVYYTANDGIDFAYVKGSNMYEDDQLGIKYIDVAPATGITIDYVPFLLMVLAAGIYMVSQMLDKRKQAQGMA